MSTVYVKLKDKGSIFHDASQEKTITGKAVVEMRLTGKVKSAIKNGVLVKTDAPESTDTAKSSNEGGAIRPDKPSYSKMKKSELQKELDDREIDYEDDATNAALVELLEADDAKKR